MSVSNCSLPSLTPATLGGGRRWGEESDPERPPCPGGQQGSEPPSVAGPRDSCVVGAGHHGAAGGYQLLLHFNSLNRLFLMVRPEYQGQALGPSL